MLPSSLPSSTALLQLRPRIKEGDLVIIYEDFKNLHAVRIAPPEVFWKTAWDYGSLPHADIVGRRFGTKVNVGKRDSFVYLLSPSPELWTATLPHRTQILYIADISMIVLQLEVQRGSVVIEAGTGSGSLSHALARAAGGAGHLHTFEFNAHRAELAAGEFAANGLSGRVTCKHGDVCAESWSYEGLDDCSVDAAIFDLPQPWEAVRRVAPLIRPGGRLCTFSPCIEQIARTLDVLASCGFTGAETVEVLVRTHEVRQAQPPPDALASVVEQARARRAAAADASAASEAPDAGAEAAAAEAAAEASGGGVGERPGNGPTPTAAAGEKEKEQETQPKSKRPRVDETLDPGPTTAAPADATPAAAKPRLLCTRPYADMRGHTGFLMFCTKHVG